MDQEQSLTRLIEASVTRKGGARDDALLQVRSFSDMETKLGAAPLALGIMGQLAVVSATSPDFSLVTEDTSQGGKFEKLKFPNSFRACLAQVGNSVHGALLAAHSNMGFIDITMIQIPGQMSDVIGLLRRGTPDEIKAQLPIHLEAMRNTSDMSKKKVEEVLNKFDLVIDTLKELVEGTHKARGDTEEALKKADLQLKLAAFEEEQFKNELARVEEELDKVTKKIEEEEREFKAELDSAGSWQEVLKQTGAGAADTGLNVVVPAFAASGSMALMASTFTNVESMAAAAVMGLGSAAKMAGASSGATAAPTAADNVPPPVTQEERDIAQCMTTLENYGIQPLFGYFKTDHCLDMVKLKKEETLKESLGWSKKIKEKVKKMAKNSKVPRSVKYDSVKLIEDLEALCGKLKQARTTGSAAASEELYEDLIQIQGQAEELGDIQLAAYGNPVHQPPSPGFLDKAKNTIGKSSISADLAKRMFTKLELRKEQLRSTETRAEELRKRKLEQNKELHRVLKEIATFEEDKMTHAQIMETIIKGLRALYQLREQWVKLFLYFKEIDNLIQGAMGPAMDMFIKLADTEKNRMLTEASNSESMTDMSDYTKEILYQKMTQAVVTSRVVLFLSKGYLSLSEGHLMPMINSFGELLSLTSQDKQNVMIQQGQLMTRATAAQEAIGAIIESGHKEFMNDLQERRQAIEEAYEAQPALQGVSAEVKREMKQKVQAGYRKAEEKVAASAFEDDEFEQ